MAKILLKNIKGPKGDKGDTGDTGIQGVIGDTGGTGDTGDKGDKFSIKKVYLDISDFSTNKWWEEIDADLDVGDYYIIKLNDDATTLLLMEHRTTANEEQYIATMSGSAGMKGEVGDKGETGDTGTKGETGDKGETGTSISGITTNTSNISIKWSNNSSTNLTMPTATNGSKGETGDNGKQCVYTLDDDGNLSYEIQ